MIVNEEYLYQYLPDELSDFRVHEDTWTYVDVKEHGGSEEVTEIHKTIKQVSIKETKWYKEQANGLLYYNDVLVVFKGPKDGITHLTIKEGTRTIVSRACAWLNGAVIDIPDSVVAIGKDAFKDVPLINYHGTALGAPWGAKCVNGCIDGDFIFSDISKTRVVGYIGSATDITIPYGIKEIGDDAFCRQSDLISIDIPETVERIGRRAFDWCRKVHTVKIPDGVRIIEDWTFSGCVSLEIVDLPETIKEIGDFAFSRCKSLHSISIPSGVTRIGSGAFDGCESLENIVIPETVEEIGVKAFTGCKSLRRISIPAGTKMKRCSFNGCKSLENIILPENVEEFDLFGPFAGCQSLKSIKIPLNIKRVDKSFFEGCTSLESVDIPDRTGIGEWHFTDCPNLKCINIHHVPDGGDIRKSIICSNKVEIHFVEAQTIMGECGKELKEETDQELLDVDERRKVCDSCKNHKNEIITNPNSPALCGLTMKAPSFHGKECELYIPIPNHKSRIIRRGIYGLVMALGFGILGVIRLVELIQQTKSPANLNTSGLVFCLFLIVFSIALLYFAFKSFITAARFKYPQEK